MCSEAFEKAALLHVAFLSERENAKLQFATFFEGSNRTPGLVLTVTEKWPNTPFLGVSTPIYLKM